MTARASLAGASVATAFESPPGATPLGSIEFDESANHAAALFAGTGRGRRHRRGRCGGRDQGPRHRRRRHADIEQLLGAGTTGVVGGDRPMIVFDREQLSMQFREHLLRSNFDD